MNTRLIIPVIVVGALLVWAGTPLHKGKAKNITSKDTTINFENSEPGKLPKWFAQTATGKPQQLNWKVANDNGNKVVSQSAKNEGDFFNQLGPDGTVQGAFNSPTSYITIVSNSNLSLNTWYNIVLMWDRASGNVSLYINGTLDNSTSSSVTSIQNTSIPIVIGDPKINAPHALVGSIDELRIYSRALTTNEILSFFYN